MPKNIPFLIALGLLLLLPTTLLQATDSPSPAEVKLREALRNTMLQLRTSETENATLQTAQTESAAKEKGLTAKLDTLTKQSAADRADAQKKIDGLTAKTAEDEKQLAEFKDALAKWQTAYKQATDVAASKEAERAKFADSCLKQDRLIADLKTKNEELAKLGNEILSRYEKFGLGTALTAKEPFVGITRVKLQNYVQDFEDKIAAQKAKPVGSPAPAENPAASPAPKPEPKTKTASQAKPKPTPRSKPQAAPSASPQATPSGRSVSQSARGIEPAATHLPLHV